MKNVRIETAKQVYTTQSWIQIRVGNRNMFNNVW